MNKLQKYIVKESKPPVEKVNEPKVKLDYRKLLEEKYGEPKTKLDYRKLIEEKYGSNKNFIKLNYNK